MFSNGSEFSIPLFPKPESALDAPLKFLHDDSVEVRVYELAKECGAKSPAILSVLKHLGYNVRSASNKVQLQPFEHKVLTDLIQSGELW